MKKKFVIVGIVLLLVVFYYQSVSTKDVTLDRIKELNGGVMPEYEFNENGTLSYVNGCFSERKITSTKEAVLALVELNELLQVKEEQIKEVNVERDDLGTYFQFEQVYEEIPVYGSMITIWADYEGNSGFLRADCSVIPENFSCEPIISKEKAQQIAKQYGTLEDINSSLCIYDTGDEVRLSWIVLVYQEERAYEILIDAMNGEVLYKNPTICNISGENLQVNTLGLQGKTHTIHITKNSGIYQLQDKTRKIIVYNGGGTTTNFTKFTSASKIEWNLEAVTTMFHLRTIYDYYLNLTGRYSYDTAYVLATANTVKVAVNTGIKDNAYWSGNKSMILIGTGSSSGAFFPMSLSVAKDIIAHEFTHALISNKTSLENVYYGTAGAINEAYADIFGCLIEGDWKIGEDVTKKKSLRDMMIPFNTSNPSVVGGAFYHDYKKNTSDYGGIHKNSTIISHIAYVLYQKGIGKTDIAKLWYRSLCLGYGMDADFYDVRVNVLAAASFLGFSNGQKEIINKAFDDANITKATCQESRSSYKHLYESLYITNQSVETCLPIEYRLEWEKIELDLDLYIKGKTKEGEVFVISYEIQEYRDKQGELIANLVCDEIKGKAIEQIQVWKNDVEILECGVWVYGEDVVESDCVKVYRIGSEVEVFEMPIQGWNHWIVFKK